MDAANRGSELFSVVISMKKASISTFMQENYGKEAKSNYRGGSKDIQFNYELFLRKYMIKDAKGNYTPKKPSK